MGWKRMVGFQISAFSASIGSAGLKADRPLPASVTVNRTIHFNEGAEARKTPINRCEYRGTATSKAACRMQPATHSGRAPIGTPDIKERFAIRYRRPRP